MEDPIERVRDRIAELYQQVFGDRSSPDAAASNAVLEESFDSISDILEETEQFYEELTVRNEELIITRQALEEQRRRYQELFDFAPDAYLVTDATGTVTEANQAAAAMLAVRQDLLIGKPLQVFIFREDRLLFSKLIAGHTGANQIEIQILPRIGPRITTEVTMMMAQGIGGKPAALRWVLRDVSQRKMERQALAASENRFRTIFQDSILGMQLVGLDGTVIESNHAFEEITGFSAAFTLGQDVLEGIHPEDQAKVRHVLKEISEGSADFSNLEVRYKKVDKGNICARLRISLLRNENYVPQYTIHLIENITLEKQAAAEVAELRRKMMDGIEAERLRLAQELHDGPMQDLYAAVFKLSTDDSVLMDAGRAGGTESPALSSASSTTHTNITETQEMLKQVAGTLRAICGELRPPTLGNLGLERAINSHIEHTLARVPHLTPHLELTEDRNLLPPEHRLALFRVYQQCLTNVIRHAHATDLWIHFTVDANEAMLEIRDNGQGFVLPEKLVELTRGGHYGLAGIAERVEAMGGKMRIQTAPGEGTLVRVTIPV